LVAVKRPKLVALMEPLPVLAATSSIPFVGSSLFLSTMSGDYEPFVAVYDVAADIIQPTELVSLDGLHIGNSTNTSATTLP
jgi:hypothetical protein